MLQVTNVVAKMVAKLQDQPTRCHLWTPVFVMLQPDTRTKSNTLLTVAGMRYLFVRTVSRDYSLPSWLSGGKPLRCSVHGLRGCQVQKVQSANPGPVACQCMQVN